MATLNTATSIVDFLTSQNKASDFGSRTNLYNTSGLSGAFGDYRGTAEQNTALLSRLKTTAPTATSTQAAGFQTTGTQAGDIASGLIQNGAYTPPTPKDVIDQTGPSTISSAFDLELSDAEKAADAEKAQLSMDLGAETTRGAEGLGRDVATLKRTADEGITDLQMAGDKKQEGIGEGAAGFGGAFSGTTKKSQAEVAKEVAMKQDRVRANLGDALYNQFSAFEQQFGTEFLSSLSIPEAEQFSKLPAPVRGIVMKNYQDAIGKAEEKAKKGVVDALEKLGYTVVGGQIFQTLAGKSDARAEANAAKADIPSDIAEFNYRKENGLLPPGIKTPDDWDKYKATQFGTEDSGGGGSTTFTKSQLNSGAATARIPIEDFKQLDEDSQNYFINNAIAVRGLYGTIDDEFNSLSDRKKKDPNALLKKRRELEAEIIRDINASPVGESTIKAVTDSLIRYLDGKFPIPR